VVLTGAEVKAYLEYSATFFVTLPPGAPVDPATISDPSIPDYNYDVLCGVDYDIDISRPIGDRITRLQLAGADVAPDARFVVAVNKYRRSGGGNFPGIVRTPGLQRPAGNPPIADRLGAGRGPDRPGRLLRPELAAGPRGRADRVLTALSPASRVCGPRA
jgi:5'-nucleotidase-like protein